MCFGEATTELKLIAKVRSGHSFFFDECNPKVLKAFLSAHFDVGHCDHSPRNTTHPHAIMKFVSSTADRCCLFLFVVTIISVVYRHIRFGKSAFDLDAVTHHLTTQ